MKMTKVMTIIVSVVLVAITALSLTACGANAVSIGVQAGTTGYFYVKGDELWGFDGFDNVTLNKYASPGLAVKAMLNGQVDWVVVDDGPATELVAANSGKIKLIDIELTEEEYAFGVDKAQPELLTKINTVLAQMDEDGELQKIFDLYAAGNGEGVKSAKKNLDNPETQLVVATNAEFAPFEYTDGGDTFYGIDMEIMAYIANKLGLELVIEDMAFDAVVTSIGKNEVDVGAAALTINESRKQVIDFTNFYRSAAQVLLVKSDDTTFDNCTTADDVVSIINSK